MEWHPNDTKRADLYLGISAAITELRRVQDHLIRFGLTKDEQLAGAEDALKSVGEYLCSPSTMYGFRDLCSPAPEEETK